MTINLKNLNILSGHLPKLQKLFFRAIESNYINCMLAHGSSGLKVPFSSPEQVDVLAGQVTLKALHEDKGNYKEAILDFQNWSCHLNSSY